MIAGVRINVSESRQVSEFLRRLSPAARDGVVDQVMSSIMLAAEERAKTVEIVRGRGDAPPLPDKLSWRTGHLTRSIGTDVDRAQRLWIVGSTVNYAPVHELGLQVGGIRYPVRAFLTPAAEWVIDQRAADFWDAALENLRGQL